MICGYRKNNILLYAFTTQGCKGVNLKLSRFRIRVWAAVFVSLTVPVSSLLAADLPPSSAFPSQVQKRLDKPIQPRSELTPPSTTELSEQTPGSPAGGMELVLNNIKISGVI